MPRCNKPEELKYSTPFYDHYAMMWHDSGRATKKMIELIDKMRIELESRPRQSWDSTDTILREVELFFPMP